MNTMYTLGMMDIKDAIKDFIENKTGKRPSDTQISIKVNISGLSIKEKLTSKIIEPTNAYIEVIIV